MSESLSEILARRDDTQPPEIAAIKKFVKERFNATVGVSVQKKQIIILANNASLAGSLRMHTLDLQKIVKYKSRIVIRIG